MTILMFGLATGAGDTRRRTFAKNRNSVELETNTSRVSVVRDLVPLRLNERPLLVGRREHCIISKPANDVLTLISELISVVRTSIDLAHYYVKTPTSNSNEVTVAVVTVV